MDLNCTVVYHSIRHPIPNRPVQCITLTSSRYRTLSVLCRLPLPPSALVLLLLLTAHLPHLLQLQVSRLEPLKLLLDLVALVRNAVRLLRLGPEIRYREFAVEVRAKVVHDADGEENVHAELMACEDARVSRLTLGRGIGEGVP